MHGPGRLAGAHHRPAPRRTLTSSRALAAGALVVGALALAACSGDDDSEGVSVLDLEPGACVLAQPEVTTEVETLTRVPCDVAHQQEVYAKVAYTAPDGTVGDFPGDAALVTFADGACAEAFEDYVGVDYRDSTLYFTYLLPSARGWDQGPDRDVLCFVTTTGATLTGSVEGTGT
ncbi:septum formation family protein [Sanguibacter keddieii]|uniref:septum formation family protein n=1 Tax=Sanguibacter keddieii TaxID=60920 RepID=UPI000323701D|nr:septum formation family protein [Sanguibacter keddieii]